MIILKVEIRIEIIAKEEIYLGSQTIEKYDFRSRSWQIENQWTSRRCQFACTRLENKFYICGGRDGLKTFVCFSARKKLYSFFFDVQNLD